MKATGKSIVNGYKKKSTDIPIPVIQKKYNVI